MQQGASASEKASSLSGGVSISSRSDDGRVPVKGVVVDDSEETWPTLNQSQSFKKKSSTTLTGEQRPSIERNRKGRPSRGVPLSPEEQDQLFRHEKSDRVKERRGEKERFHQRRYSLQCVAQTSAMTKYEKKENDHVTADSTAEVQTPKEYTPKWGQGIRGRGRMNGRGRYGRGRGGHPRSYSHDGAYFPTGPPSAGMHPMYPMMMHPMYYPPMPLPPPMPGMMYPPGPVPAAPVLGFSRQQFVDAAKKQIEYYLSEENLTNDTFLRSKMDNDGWIPLHVIMSFNRLRTLTMDASLILEALYSSHRVVLSDDLAFLRTIDYEKWVLPEDQQRLSHDPTLHVPYVRPAGDAGQPSQDDVFQFDEEHGQVDAASRDATTDEDLDRLIVVIQRKNEADRSKLGTMDSGTASIINEGLRHYQEQIEPMFKRTSLEEPSHHFFPSSLPKSSLRMSRRSTSPASITQRYCLLRSLEEGSTRPSPCVGWIVGTSPEIQTLKWFFPRQTQRNCVSSSSLEGSHMGSTFPAFDHPGHAHLKDGNFVQVRYHEFYTQCIKDRETKGLGESEEMRTLYRFWCYFLRSHFKESMYRDFKQFAIEDSEAGKHYGIERLFNYYCYGLEEHFDDRLYVDFEEMTLLNYDKGSLYGLEKFWAFHHYGGIPKESSVHVNTRLAELIETKYSTLDALRPKPESKGTKQGFHCASPSSTLSSAAEPAAMDHHMSSVPETENVLSVQNESLSVA